MMILHLLTETTSPLAQEVWQARLSLSIWESFPGLILLLFIGAGASHSFEWNRRRRAFKQKQRSQRVRMSLPLVIDTPVTQAFSVKTFDISLSGAFLPFEDLQNSMTFTSLIGKRNGIKIGDLVDVKVYTGRFSQFSCQARVVRYNFEDTTPFPKGIGIEFIRLSKRKKKILETLIYQASDQLESKSG